MRVDEVSTRTDPDAGRLVGLVDWLAGRAKDTNSQKRISKQAFVSMAHNLGVPVTDSNLQDMLDKPPLSNLFEPMDPQSQFLVYKGGDQATPAMPVNRAQDIVGKMAKRANPLG